jgi:hypothetical protein
MNKAVLFGAAALAALLPAVVGLTSNPSLSARVPLQPAQLQPATTPPHPTGGTSTTAPTRRPTRTPSSPATDDHGGGDRPTGSSDDTADDHGGSGKGSDDGGSGKGKGKGSGSDD